MALRTLRCLVDALAENGEAEAIIAHHADTPTVWTRRQLRDEVERFARDLMGAGVGAGEPVALIAASRPEWAAAVLGIVRTGAIAMPISEQLGAPELERIVGHSRCRRVVTTTDHLKVLAELEEAGELAILLLDEDEEADRHGLSVQGWRELSSGSGELPDLERDQPAVLVYTSGTTGTPKGVPLTHANLCANLDALVAERLAQPGDRVLLPLPLQHVYPLTVGLLAPLALGAAVVLPAGITGPQIAEALQACACTIMIAVPRLYEAMLAGIERKMDALGSVALGTYRRLLAFSIWLFRQSGWRAGGLLFAPLHRQVGPKLSLLASGGAPLKPETAWQLNGLGWEVLVGYGLSETSPILTFNPKGRARIGSVGLPVKDTEIRIEPVPDVEPGTGEIEARGPSVFAGYWQNEEATKEAFSDDGFFRTGDLGSTDHDGYLFIVGRSKEMIVVAGGKNIFPEDVEAVYGKSSLIQELAVLDHDGRLVGLIVPQVEPEGAGSGLRQKFRAEIERYGQELPSYERITDFAMTAQSLPRTQIGKLRRHLLPDLYDRAKSARGPVEEATLSDEDKTLLERTPADQVWAWLQKRFKGTRLTLDTSPELDLGLDSFEWMSLAMELQERFGFRLTEEDLARISTLRALLQEVQEAADSGQTQALAEGELGVEQERWLQPRGTVLRVFARLFFMANYAMMRGLFRVRAEGLEHVPDEGPFLITPNHLSYLDPFAIAAMLSWKQLQQVYWAGWSGILFRGPITRTFSRITQVVPVDPERGLTSTLLFARAILNRGNVLTWFPEGERSRDGKIHRFLPGAGLLIQKTRVPAVPVLITGSFEAWPATRRLPRLHPIRLRFGKPLMLADSEPETDDMEGPERIAERLREAVAALGEAAPSVDSIDDPPKVAAGGSKSS
jgi:long-chain acyl-CoA synthetase